MKYLRGGRRVILFLWMLLVHNTFVVVVLKDLLWFRVNILGKPLSGTVTEVRSPTPAFTVKTPSRRR